ncbi:hypothetical protein, partial [Citrobacter youngae]|uniref:hypothetical protein n=1 Tax=Citrobacter youngae TaxID=133448 RepID=UPI0019544C7C
GQKSSIALAGIYGRRQAQGKGRKVSSSLERNKFYSFALDKTITPDTKASSKGPRASEATNSSK